MDLFIRAKRVQMQDVSGEIPETVLVEYGTKKITLKTIIESDGKVNSKFVVYDGDLSIMGTPNINDAMKRYNAIGAAPEAVQS